MRTIKFRGKVVLGHASNQWKEGDLIQYHMQEDQQVYNANIRNSCGIVYAINPKTLGQFTGLYDKNGKEIWEGDIIKWKDGHGKETIDYVKFTKGVFMLHYINFSIFYYPETEIIGNIHENPELLEQ